MSLYIIFCKMQTFLNGGGFDSDNVLAITFHRPDSVTVQYKNGENVVLETYNLELVMEEYMKSLKNTKNSTE
ncbi:MAG: hypothetical protein ACR2PY_04440 [Salinispira sp.]